MCAWRVGLLGYPLAHSISPVFQQAAFDALGIDARYERWPVPPEALPGRLQRLRDTRILGANVTVPHKEAVIPWLDAIEEIARRVGAVNTIVRQGERLLGTNTDVDGFRRALRESGGFDPGGKRALVLGAGGAARAVVLALLQDGAARIAIANRHPERAERLAGDLGDDTRASVHVVDWEEAAGGSGLRNTDLLVHCTTLGLAGSQHAGASPLADGVLHRDLFVCDIVANPLETPLLRQARAAGADRLGGLPMLVFQGAASFERWTGRPAPAAVMMDAALSAMDETGQSGKVG
jgi:shikimate dehydrogenase